MKNPIENIDFTELRNQKRTLLTTISVLEDVLGGETILTNNGLTNTKEMVNHLTGILYMIDSIQDYAVDVLGWDANLVFDFEMEEGRDD